MEYRKYVNLIAEHGVPVANKKINHENVIVEFMDDSQNTYIELTFEFFNLCGDEYVLFPACAYNGNKFDSLKKAYPPMFELDEASKDMPVTITDVPRLNKDGSGEIEVTTGDLSVPCAGFFSGKLKESVFLFTGQGFEFGNFGIAYKFTGGKVIITLTAPHMRKKSMYRWPFMVPSTDKGMDFKAGQRVEIPYKLYILKCESIQEFYEHFFNLRRCMDLEDSLAENIPFSEAFKIQENKFNLLNWRRYGRYYSVGTTSESTQDWQPGWVGGGMSSYALMALGCEDSYWRGVDTLRHLFSSQTKAGFYHGIMSESGDIKGDGFDVTGTEKFHLIRKSADVLYFIFKHFELMKKRGMQIPDSFIKGAKRTADAFSHLWERYGDLGQFVNEETGEIIVGGSTAGGITPAGLVAAGKFFGNQKYIETAKNIAQMYYDRDLMKGYTTGGRAEIVQCPDSESAFGLLESFVELYEATGEQKWLDYSKHMAAFCSSWVVAYNYKFPVNSEFARLGMRTAGSVFANSQNKHSAPGICTLSGSSLFKLFRFTGDLRYLHLCRDIARGITQYMSTEDRPIFSWDNQPEKLPSGFMCERVNMSDWENYHCVGGVFNGSCWCETSLLLSMTELPSVYILPDKQIVCAMDHLKAEFMGDKIVISNNTPYDSQAKIFIESLEDLKQNLGMMWFDRFKLVNIKALQSIEILL